MKLNEIIEQYGDAIVSVAGKGIAYGLQKALEELGEKIKETDETFDDKITIQVSKIIIDELQGFVANLEAKQ